MIFMHRIDRISIEMLCTTLGVRSLLSATASLTSASRDGECTHVACEFTATNDILRGRRRPKAAKNSSLRLCRLDTSSITVSGTEVTLSLDDDDLDYAAEYLTGCLKHGAFSTSEFTNVTIGQSVATIYCIIMDDDDEIQSTIKKVATKGG